VDSGPDPASAGEPSPTPRLFGCPESRRANHTPKKRERITNLARDSGRSGCEAGSHFSSPVREAGSRRTAGKLEIVPASMEESTERSTVDRRALVRVYTRCHYRSRRTRRTPASAACGSRGLTRPIL
jgi:hypothetical protein